MARLILDTTVLIAAERTSSSLNRLIADQDDVAIAAVTAAELLVGVELADDARQSRRAAFVRSVLDTIPIEDYDVQVARAHASLLAYVRRSGRPRGAHDLMIAATAVARDRLVVSADTSAFADLPGVSARS
ncbi:MAG: PIN domain-containing protein [Sporichthyaceae bacterium]|nr:PIN domain-containing protein [Sporichthyaceae bacterium]